MSFRSFYFLFLGFLTLLLTGSCVSRKKIAYFQGLQQVEKRQLRKNIEIEAGDLLNIVVSAPELAAAQPFNNFRPTPGINQGAGGGNTEPLAYLVSDDGTIDFPTLGKMKVTGLTGKQLEETLKQQLEEYVQDPVVTVRIENFQITILGEVRNPGTFKVANDDISLPQALGLAGDITLSGKRSNILVVREKKGQKQYAYLDLSEAEVMNSPYYYLKQNDVVYVEPIGPKIQTTSYLGTAASYLSIASVALSLIFLFTK